MTNEQIREALKTCFAIVIAVVPLLAAFGPLAEYRETILLIGGIIAAVAAALGFNLQSPAAQVRNVKAMHAQRAAMAEMLRNKGQG